MYWVGSGLRQLFLRPTRQSVPRGTHRFWFGCSTPRCALMMDYIYRILPCLYDSSCRTEPQTAMSHMEKNQCYKYGKILLTIIQQIID